jgi:hypothetical protein
MANGKLVWINFGNIDALTMLTKSFEVKSPNNVISILVDLAQKTKDIQLKQMRVCPTCNKEYEIEQITSGAYKLKDHIRHCDLDNTNCKQICKLERRIKLESKDKANGTNESNDNKRAQTDKKEKEETLEEMYKRLEENTKEFERQRELERQEERERQRFDVESDN